MQIEHLSHNKQPQSNRIALRNGRARCMHEPPHWSFIMTYLKRGLPATMSRMTWLASFMERFSIMSFIESCLSATSCSISSSCARPAMALPPMLAPVEERGGELSVLLHVKLG